MIKDAVILCALIGFLVYGLRLAKGIRLQEYVSNRDRSDFKHVFFSLLGTCLGGWMFFGVGAIGYEAGVVGYAIGLAYCLGLLMMGALASFIKRICREENCDIIDDVLEVRFGRNVRYMMSTVNILVFVAFVASQFVALVALLGRFGGTWPTIAACSAVAVVIAYTAAAGFRGVLGTDLVQCIVFGVGACCLFVFLTVTNDAGFIDRIPDQHLLGVGDPGLGYGVAFLVGVLVFFAPSLIVRSDLWQRIASAQDDRSVRKAFWCAAPIMVLAYFIFTTIGIYARTALGPGLGRDSAVAGLILFEERLISNVGSVGGREALLTVVILGLFAAVLSTADSFLNLLATTFSKLMDGAAWNEFKEQERRSKQGLGDPGSGRVGGRSPTERFLLRRLRGTTIVLGLVCVMVAVVVPSIVDLIVGSASAIIIFAPTVLMGVVSEKPNRQAGFWSMASGLIVFVGVVAHGFVTTGAYEKAAFIPGLLAALVAYISVAVLTRPRGRQAGSG